MEPVVQEVRVREMMTRDVVTLSQGQSLPLASELMKLSRIRHLPVIDAEGRLVGLVTHRNLLDAQVSALTPLTEDERAEVQLRVPVSRVMRTDVWTVSPDATALSAARLMYDHRFGCVPVVEDDRRLVGIVTEADLVALLIESLMIDATHIRGQPSAALVDRKGGDVPTLVRDVMTPHPATVPGDTTAGAARRHMQREGIRHLPVTVEGELAGIVSERDLRTAEALRPDADGVRLGTLCTKPAFVVNLHARLDAVVQDMADERVGSALVLDGGELVGIVTGTDIARALSGHLRSEHPSPGMR